MSNKEDIIRKIRALMAKATNEAASDNEVFIFMAKAQELRAKYKIEESELNINKDEITSRYFDLYINFFDQINSYINKEYLSSLAYIISTNNFCKTVYNSSFKHRKDVVYYYDRIRFIGKIDDINNSMELFEFSYRKFFNLGKLRYEEAKRVRSEVGKFKFKAVNSYQYVDKLVFFRSYLKGTLSGLQEKFEENKDKLDNIEGYGLIVSNYKHSIDNFINENIGKLSTSTDRNYNKQDDDAFELGKFDAKISSKNMIQNE